MIIFHSSWLGSLDALRIDSRLERQANRRMLIMTLREIDGLSFRQIANQVGGLSATSARTAYINAVRQFRKEFSMIQLLQRIEKSD